MPRFTYHAADSDGRLVSGEIEASSLAAAVADAEGRGLAIRSIAETVEVEPEIDPALERAAERVLAARETLTEPLSAYARETPPGRRRRELRAVLRAFETGDAAMVARAAKERPAAWAPLLAATATRSAPDEALARFLHRDRPMISRQRRRSLAHAYPIFILGLVLMLIWPLAAFVIPEFDAVFRTFGLELPALTQLLVAISRGMSSVGALAVGGLVAAAVGLLWSWPFWRPAWLLTSLRWLGLPAYGSGPAAAAVAATAADLIEAGLDGPLAAELARSKRDAEANEAAQRPTLAMALTVDSPNPALLRELAACYADRSAGASSWADGNAGPTALVVVGLVVGFVVVSLFLPLIKLIEGLT